MKMCDAAGRVEKERDIQSSEGPHITPRSIKTIAWLVWMLPPSYILIQARTELKVLFMHLIHSGFSQAHVRGFTLAAGPGPGT